MFEFIISSFSSTARKIHKWCMFLSACHFDNRTPTFSRCDVTPLPWRFALSVTFRPYLRSTINWEIWIRWYLAYFSQKITLNFYHGNSCKRKWRGTNRGRFYYRSGESDSEHVPAAKSNVAILTRMEGAVD